MASRDALENLRDSERRRVQRPGFAEIEARRRAAAQTEGADPEDYKIEDGRTVLREGVAERNRERAKSQAEERLLEELGTGFSEDDVVVEQTESGFRASLKPSAVTTEEEAREQAVQDALEQAGDDFDESDVSVSRTDSGFQASLKESAVEERRERAKQEAVESVLEQSGGDVAREDVEVAVQDGEITASLKESERVSRKRGSREAAVKGVLENAGEGFSERDVIVDAEGGSFTARIKESAMERERQEARERAEDRAVESLLGNVGGDFDESDVNVEWSDDGVQAGLTDEAQAELRERAKDEAATELLGDVEGFGRDDVVFRETDEGGIRAELDEEAQKIAKDRAEDEARRDARQELLTQAGEDFGPGDVSVERTEQGFRASLSEEAVQREREEAREDAVDQVLAGAGPGFTEGDVAVTETGDGAYRASLKDSAIEREREEAREEAVTGLLDSAGGGFDRTDVEVRRTDEGFEAYLTEAAAERQEDELRERTADRAVDDLLSSAADGFDRDDVSVEFTDEGVRASLEQSAVQRERREARQELKQQVASEAGEGFGTGDVTVTSKGDRLQASLTPEAQRRARRQARDDAVQAVIDQTDGEVGRSDVAVSRMDDGRYEAKLKESASREMLAEDLLGKETESGEKFSEFYNKSDITYGREDDELTASFSEQAVRRERAEAEERARENFLSRTVPGTGVPEEFAYNLDASVGQEYGDYFDKSDIEVSENEEGELVVGVSDEAEQEFRREERQDAREQAIESALDQRITNPETGEALGIGTYGDYFDESDVEIERTDDGYRAMVSEEAIEGNTGFRKKAAAEQIEKMEQDNVEEELDLTAGDVTIEDGEIRLNDEGRVKLTMAKERFGNDPLPEDVEATVREFNRDWNQKTQDYGDYVEHQYDQAGAPGWLGDSAAWVGEAIHSTGNWPQQTAIALNELTGAAGEGFHQSVRGNYGEWAREAGAAETEMASAAWESGTEAITERPLETGVKFGTTLVLTGGATYALAKTAPRAARATAWTIQPGEEIASATLTRAAPGVAKKFPGGRIDWEEPVVYGTARAARGAYEGASTVAGAAKRGASAATPKFEFSTEARMRGESPFAAEVTGTPAPSKAVESVAESARNKISATRESVSPVTRARQEAKSARFKASESVRRAPEKASAVRARAGEVDPVGVVRREAKSARFKASESVRRTPERVKQQVSDVDPVGTARREAKSLRFGVSESVRRAPERMQQRASDLNPVPTIRREAKSARFGASETVRKVPERVSEMRAGASDVDPVGTLRREAKSARFGASERARGAWDTATGTRLRMNVKFQGNRGGAESPADGVPIRSETSNPLGIENDAVSGETEAGDGGTGSGAGDGGAVLEAPATEQAGEGTLSATRSSVETEQEVETESESATEDVSADVDESTGYFQATADGFEDDAGSYDTGVPTAGAADVGWMEASLRDGQTTPPGTIEDTTVEPTAAREEYTALQLMQMAQRPQTGSAATTPADVRDSFIRGDDEVGGTAESWLESAAERSAESTAESLLTRTRARAVEARDTRQEYRAGYETRLEVEQDTEAETEATAEAETEVEQESILEATVEAEATSEAESSADADTGEPADRALFYPGIEYSGDGGDDPYANVGWLGETFAGFAGVDIEAAVRGSTQEDVMSADWELGAVLSAEEEEEVGETFAMLTGTELEGWSD